MGSSRPSKEEIYDPIRKRWVVATPEEMVRQALLEQMISKLSYPRELLSIEKSLFEMPHLSQSPPSCYPDRRVDVVCFAKGIHKSFPLYPLLLVECKESSSLAEEAKQQVIGYNYFIKACFVAVAYPEGSHWGYYDSRRGAYVFSSDLPPYERLIRAVADATK